MAELDKLTIRDPFLFENDSASSFTDPPTEYDFNQWRLSGVKPENMTYKPIRDAYAAYLEGLDKAG
jgi:hypothetical protein